MGVKLVSCGVMYTGNTSVHLVEVLGSIPDRRVWLYNAALANDTILGAVQARVPLGNLIFLCFSCTC